MNVIDPDGKDGIYITYPDYEIHVGSRTNNYVGHAGVLLIDNKTGTTKYYEYGRYDKENKGLIRNIVIPDAVIGSDGKPTEASINRILSVLSAKAGQHGRIKGAYVESDEYEAMLDYANYLMSENYNPDRKSYNLLMNNCGTVAADILKQDDNVKQKFPIVTSSIPNLLVWQLQHIFTPINFTPSTN